jgi:4-amino-4-deoxy-L-arabinose transferase-like glycosyltransferase
MTSSSAEMLLKSKTNQFLSTALVIFILCTATIIRLNNLEVDPDIRISGDAGIFTDEGLYSLSAKNLALFGKFNPNPENQIVEAVDSPFYTYSEFLAFKIFGVTIKALRIPSIFYSILILFVTYFLVRRLFGYLPAVLATAFLSFNHMFIQHNRLALLENLIILMLLLSSYFCVIQAQERKVRFLIAGIFFGLATITKATAIFFLPAMLLSIAFGNLETGWWKRNAWPLVYFFIGLGTIISLNKIYMLLIIETGLLDSNLANKNISLQAASLLQIARDLFCFGSVGDWFKSVTQILISRFSLSMPLIFFFACFYCVWFFSTTTRPLSESRRAELLFAMWILSGILFMSFFTYQPNRYRIPLIPPLCILAAIGISRIYVHQSTRMSIFKTKYFPYVAGIASVFFIYRFMRVIVVMNSILFMNEWIVAVSVAFGTVFVLALKKRGKLELNVPRDLKKLTVLCFLIGVLFLDFYQYGRWARNPICNIKEGNEKIKGLVESGIIGGWYAPILCLETSNIAVPLMRENLLHFNRLHLTHYLDSVHYEPNENFILMNQYNPNFLENAKLMAQMPIGFVVASLYSFKP